jgi:hypothetical protein
LGIDLGADGVTPNDLGDADMGANLQQNFPVISTAFQSGARGTLNSTASGTFFLQFYTSPTASQSGYGEEMTYLTAKSVTTDASGNASFTVTFPAPVPVGYVISATATDSSNDTSEFGFSVPVAADATLNIVRLAGGQFTLMYPTTPAGFGVVQTANLNPPVVWAPLTNNAVPVGNTNRITLAPTNGQMRYYKIQLQ